MKDYLAAHGISEETANKLGLTEIEHKIVIPIKDQFGELLFNKYRHLLHDSDSSVPKFTYDSGSNSQLYNLEAIKDNQYAFIFEGEPDVWKATEDGIPAVSSTSGAGTFNPEWAVHFANKKVFICYDNDPAGEAGAAKVQEILPDALRLILPDGKDYCEYRQKHSLTEFKRLIGQLIKDNTLSYSELCDVIDKWLLLPDKNVIKIILATVISHSFTTDPLWMFLVAPPSGTKTELISSLAVLPKVFPLSDLTAQTLASGLNWKEDPSLLAKLHDNIIIMKDFTTVLSMRFEERQIILSQLREIYDGKYHKEFGSGKTVDWEGKITLLAGVTPYIDTQLSIFQVMGERFLMYRVPQADDTLVAEKALANYGQEKAMRAEISAAMVKFFRNVQITKANDILLPPDILKALASLASFIVVTRSSVMRNNYTKEIEYIPTPEAPARLAKQLGVMLKALALLHGRTEINWEDYYLTMRIAFDVISRHLMKHFISVCAHSNPTTAEVANDTHYSLAGAEIILGDLVALNILNVSGQGIGITKYWNLSEKTKKYFKNILPKDNVDYILLNKYFPKDDFYYPIINQILENNKDLEDL